MPTRTLPDNRSAWDDLPPDVQGALEALHREFEKLHVTYGHATRSLCHWSLTNDWGDDDDRYAKSFLDWSDRYPAIHQHHCDLITQNTPPTTFRAFFDFYIEMVAMGIRRIFAELIAIGCAHEAYLKQPGIAWAKAQAQQMIQNCRHVVVEWVRAATDRQSDRKAWRAPLFLTMQLAGHNRYDPDRAWERMDAASSLQILQAFAAEYGHRLENCIEDDAGDAYRAMVRRPKAAGKTIEGKVIERSAPGALEMDAGSETDRQKLIQLAKNAKEGETFSYKQAAIIFDVSTKTIQNWIKKKKLKKHPKKSRIFRTSVRRLLD